MSLPEIPAEQVAKRLEQQHGGEHPNERANLGAAHGGHDKLTPVDRAKLILGDGWDDALAAHLRHGAIHSTPDLFAMARPCPRGAVIVGPWRTWPAAECNAWFAWIVVGELGAAVRALPYDLPWLGWWREGRGWGGIHWAPTKRVGNRR